MNSISVLTTHLNLFTSYQPHKLEVHSQSSLKVKGWCKQLYEFLFCSNYDYKQLQQLIHNDVTLLSSLERRYFIKEDGEATELFIAAQRFNQLYTPEKIVNQQVQELMPTSITATDKSLIIPNDQPVKQLERRFFNNHVVNRYPDDHSDHGREAFSIFFNTQRERILSGLGYVIETCGSAIGYEIEAFKKYHYRSHGETDAQLYGSASPLSFSNSLEPTSYWLGHASILMSVPLRSDKGNIARFNIVTDPVEGNLNFLLYPRKTQIAREVQSLPSVHVYLLSHNHLDHCDMSATAKLMAQQPLMIVPSGDGPRYQKVGFQHVVEMNWWEKQTIEFRHQEETFKMQICATPARHWAGQGPCQGHESTFLGYVIQGAEGGDIYFAGDTGRLNDDHVQKLRDHFNIRWTYQPGGPDEVREDMESTHQSSADALWMHFNLMAKKHYVAGMAKEEFLAKIAELKTIFMHTMTFKLGNLHLSDTKDSVQRVLEALTNPVIALQGYEQLVVNELMELANQFQFADNKKLSPKEVQELLRETVAVPKIGSRIGLSSPLQTSDLF